MDNKQSTSKLVHPSRNISVSKSGHSPDPRSNMTLTGDPIARAVAEPRRLLPDDVVALQRTIGNQAVVQLLQRQASAPAHRPASLQPLGVQPKLTVGPARDAYEIEADQVANQIVRTPAPISAKQAQREEDTAIRQTPAIQRIQRNAPVGLKGGAVDKTLESSLRRAQNGGSALPSGVRRTLEPRLGADLSTVKVHTGTHAAQLSRDFGAKAFTHKNHIFYGAGQSPSDVKLTAHETVHTIQQGAVNQAPVQRSHLRPGDEIAKARPDIPAGNGQAIVQRAISIEERMAKLAQNGMQDPTAVTAAQKRRQKSPWNKVRAGLKDIPTLMDPDSKEMTKTKQGATWARRQDKKDQISDPSTYMSKWEITSHLAHFADGGHAFVKPEFHEKIHRAFGKDDQGNLTGFGGWGNDANFVMPLSAAHALTQEAHQAEGILTIEQRLGIESGKDWSWAHPQKNPQKILYRYILKNPGKFGVRMPKGKESGAYKNEWVAGGKTLGGGREAVVNKLSLEDLALAESNGDLEIRAERFPETPDLPIG